MGKKKEFLHSFQRNKKNKRDARIQRSTQEKQKRRYEPEVEKRQISKIIITKARPTEFEVRMLEEQIFQSLRIPVAADSLMAHIKSLITFSIANSKEELQKDKKKRQREVVESSAIGSITALDSILHKIVLTKTEKNEQTDNLAVLMENDCANNFICTLIRLILTEFSVSDIQLKEVQSLLEHTDELINYILADCDVTSQEKSKLLSTIVQSGNDKQRNEILTLIKKMTKKEKVENNDQDNLNIINKLLCDRYLSNLILKLLEHYRNATVLWLNCLILGASQPEINAPSDENLIQEEKLFSIANDQIAGNIMQSWIDNSNKEYLLFKKLNTPNALKIFFSSKRGIKFLTSLLEPSVNFEDAKHTDSEFSLKVLNRMLKIFSEKSLGDSWDIFSLSVDSERNYLVQHFFAHIAVASKFESSEAQKIYNRIVFTLNERKPSESPTNSSNDRHQMKHNWENKNTIPLINSFIEMAVHPIGCHSLMSFIDSVVSAGNNLDLNLLAQKILNSKSIVMKLIGDQFGGLVIRHFITSKNLAVLKIVFDFIEEKIQYFSFDKFGNLAIQQLFRATEPKELFKIYAKHIKPHLFEMAENQYAAHVVIVLFECADTKLITDMVINLKTHVLRLSKHINGRFIVEKLIPHSSEVRQILIKNFVNIAQSKGTQHVLMTLWDMIDDSSAKQLVQNSILPNIQLLSTNVAGTVCIQKLIQDSQCRDAKLHPAKAFFCKSAYEICVKNSAMKNELAKDFYGVFVINMLTGMSF